MKFERDLFTPRKYSREELKKYLKNAVDDLKIAEKSKDIKIRFRFGYDSLIKLAIFLLAYHAYKLRSVPGHHLSCLKNFLKLLRMKI